jgi:drug/metabolite transporter (DMT)-like permease
VPPLQIHKPRFLGCLAIFGSTLFLYLSTLVIRWSQSAVAIDPAYFAFARFLLGFLVVCTAMKAGRTGIKVRRYHLLIGRAITNSISVFCFYMAVSVTTVAEANILNMTYPLFVTLFSWGFLKGQRDLRATLTLLIAFIGVWLVLSPDALRFNLNNIWGLTSGIFGAAAIVYLNLSRQYHDTNTVLFFLFGLGAVIIILCFHEKIFFPGPVEFTYLFFCAGFGVIGQYLLTIGFRYVTAVEGSVISSSRILLAAILGPYLAADPFLSAAGWLGAILIFGADVYLSIRKTII